MLEGVQIDLAGVQRFVGQVVGVEFDELDIDARILFIQDLLHGLPLVVVGTADADLDNGLALLGGGILHDLLGLFLGQGDFVLIVEGREEGLFVVDQQELGNGLGLVSLDDGLVDLVLGVLCTGGNDVYVGVVAVLALLFNDQAVAGGDQPEGDGIGAVDGGGAEVGEGGRQGVGLHRGNLDIIEVAGDIGDLGRIAGLRVDRDKTGGLQQLDAAGQVRAIIGDADGERVGKGRQVQGKDQGCRQGKGKYGFQGFHIGSPYFHLFLLI